MKIARVLDPITLNAILPWSFPVRHLPALFRYLLKFYNHSFLKVFIISHSASHSAHSASRLCPFPTFHIIIITIIRLCGQCFVAIVKVRICKKEHRSDYYRCSRSSIENELGKRKHRWS